MTDHNENQDATVDRIIERDTPNRRGDKLMRTLDITYTDEEGHKSGAELIDYNLGDEDEEIFIDTWDWFDSTGESRAIGTIRKSDIPKLIAFLQEVD